MLGALPALVKNASLTDMGKADVDWYAFTATAADVAKHIHVVTSDSDLETDSVVDVFAVDETTSLGGPSLDMAYQEEFLSDKIAAEGTYYVVVSDSPFYDPAHSAYNVQVTLE